MKYSLRVFFSIVIVLTLGFTSFGYWLLKEIRNQYSLSIEESLVDFSKILASYVSSQSHLGKLEVSNFKEAFLLFRKSNFKANIHGVIKKQIPIDAYITDGKGIVVYDSRSEVNVGKDFSRWNDVYLTLKGEYGARSTRTVSNDPLSSVFFVASPIIVDGNIKGVVSVIKAEKSLRQFIEMGRQKVFFVALTILIISMAFACLLTMWLVHPINKLIHYAKKVTKGESARPPKMGAQEFSNLAKAFDEMRISLEGKKSVESFVQHLTHELKSPLTAIRGAAEILRDDMPTEKKDMFLNNIDRESKRARKQLEELLHVASLESKSELQNIEQISLTEVIDEVKASFQSLLEKNNIDLIVEKNTNQPTIEGEKSLIQKAISSLVMNAIEFSPENSKIRIEIAETESQINITVCDQGPGIPEYAKYKIFDKFYSLERPKTGKKSTGLGLSFVKESIQLHGGEVIILPVSDTGQGANILISLSK